MFAERPRTTMQAATHLGEPPTRLYHHVAALERSGLVRLRETRSRRGATEKYFEAVLQPREAGTRRRGGRAALSPADGDAVALVVFDQARNEMLRAMGAIGKAKPAALMAVRGVLRMSPARARRLEKELAGMLKGLGGKSERERANRSPSRGPKGRYSLTIALLPLEPDDDER
jgi:predicted ArsR family transcriptional regulator